MYSWVKVNIKTEELSLQEVYDAELDAVIEEVIGRQQAELQGFFELSAEEQQNVNYSVSEEISGRYQYFYEVSAGEHPEASSAELREYAKENAYPIADAGALFQSELDHGQTYEELITALINHPGNYGHNLYYLALKSLFVFE